jgi:hypothetical protein
MGRESEAQPIIDSVLEEAPTDESTLQAMNIAFKELQQRQFDLYIEILIFQLIYFLFCEVKRGFVDP